MDRFLRLGGLLCVAGLLGIFPTADISAQAPDAPLSVALSPIEGHGPWRYRLALTSHRAQEVTYDRRLLQLEVKPEGSRRRFRCTHPDAPREGVRRTMATGEVHEEWVDLRMFCSGSALRALRWGSAEVGVQFGYRRRGRGRFVARIEGERRPATRIEGGTIQWDRAQSTPSDAPIRVGIDDDTSRGAVRFRPTIRASANIRPIVYMRDDHFSFEVRGPRGVVMCRRPRAPIYPIRERFFRLTNRKRRNLLDAAYYCPDGTFEQPGLYQVRPTLELPYDGERFGLDALTGTFVGSTGVVRVRGTAYEPHPMDSLPALHAGEEHAETEPSS